ncbi:GumC family protein [Leptolyngbya sp. KIOST-1]|uniref:GumC family protein n=1 Tax=Leptolyngbya sp. KIOST-1 TaxID=1229172 RepID=UPI00068CA8C4|nr:polysaccharide biosynthesis tyrosine autokinase [Leptolyngbya sp. KIOST-1]
MVSTSTLPTTTEQEFGYGQLFQILLRRWPWIITTLGLATAGAVFVSLRQDPIYRSNMQLLVEPNYQQELNSSDLSSFADQDPRDADYATQLALMRSGQFLQEAVNVLRTDYPEITVDELRAGFSLNRLAEGRTGTRIFQASYTASDPAKPQRVLAALQDIYLEYNQNQQAQRLSRGLDNVNARLSNTRQNLQDSQAALEQFRISQNLIDPSSQALTVVESLNQVQNQQQQLLVELSGLEQQYITLEQQIRLSPQTGLLAARLSQSPRIQTLLDALQTTDLALADRRILFTDQDPNVQVLQQQRENQLAQLRTEISAISRQNVTQLDPTLLSYLQLGGIDFGLVSRIVDADVTLQSLEARMETLNSLESVLREEINRYPSLMAEYDRLQPAVDTERSTLQELLIQREQLSAELARGGFSWEVVEPPQLGRRIGPDPVRPLALGIVAGLFAGGALAFLAESIDKRVRTSDELQKQVPLPLLGILPRRSSALPALRRAEAEGGLHPELADSELMKTVIWPQFRDSLDLIANNLQLLQKSHLSQAIAITSALPGEGKTTLALGLAFSLARMGQRVLIIDADLRRSGIQTGLGLAQDQGLSSLLLGEAAQNRPHRLDFGHVFFDVLAAGPVPEDPISLLSSPRFKQLLKRAKERYDLVLVDTPPLLGMADALKVGGVCDSTVLVTRLDRITQSQLTEAMVLLTHLNVMGLIANGARQSPNRYIYDPLPPANGQRLPAESRS